MKNKETLYKNIKSELLIYISQIKAIKKAKPIYKWEFSDGWNYGKTWCSQIETLNILRFLNAYIYFIKHDGKKFEYKVKNCQPISIGSRSKGWDEINSNINRFLCTFIEFREDHGFSMIAYHSTCSYITPLRLSIFRHNFIGIDKIIDVFCKIHEYNGENKDKFFTEETEEFRKWFIKIHY